MLLGKIHHGCGWGIGCLFWGLTCAAVIRQKLVAGVEELYGYLSFRTCMLLRLKMMSIFSEVQAKLVESLQYILSINCFFWYTGSLLQPRMGKRREHKEGFWSCTSKDFQHIRGSQAASTDNVLQGVVLVDLWYIIIINCIHTYCMHKSMKNACFVFLQSSTWFYIDGETISRAAQHLQRSFASQVHSELIKGPELHLALVVFCWATHPPKHVMSRS